MRVAVAGSTGFIGSALVEHLRGAHHDVVRMVRPSSGRDGIAWDPGAGTIDAAALDGVDAVVNLAGATVGRRWTRAHKARVLDSRVRGTDLIARTVARLEHGPRVLVNGSAVGFYGDRGTQVLDETSGPGRGFLSEVVQAWEAAAAPAASAGVRVVSIRTGLALSPRGGLLKRLLIPFRLGVGGRLGPGVQYMPWIALADHVRAVASLLSVDVAGPVNLVAPNPVTNVEFTHQLASVLDRPGVMAVPRVALAAVLGRELTADVLASQRVVPAVLQRTGFDFAHAELRPALEAMFAR